MKNTRKIGLSFLLTILLLGCDTNDNVELDSENSIIGNWKLVESYISSGGPQYLVEIENGEEFQFLIIKPLLQTDIQNVQKRNSQLL